MSRDARQRWFTVKWLEVMQRKLDKRYVVAAAGHEGTGRTIHYRIVTDEPLDDIETALTWAENQIERLVGTEMERPKKPCPHESLYIINL